MLLSLCDPSPAGLDQFSSAKMCFSTGQLASCVPRYQSLAVWTQTFVTCCGMLLLLLTVCPQLSLASESEAGPTWPAGVRSSGIYVTSLDLGVQQQTLLGVASWHRHGIANSTEHIPAAVHLWCDKCLGNCVNTALGLADGPVSLCVTLSLC